MANDQELLLRVFRVALQRIAEDRDGIICECTHDNENCCEEMDVFCAVCIAAKALHMETTEAENAKA